MLTGLSFGAALIGLLVGRLYSFVGVLIVSPLVWLVAAVALWPAHPWWALLEAVAILVVLHVGFLGGAAARLRSDRRTRSARPHQELRSSKVGPRRAG